MAKTKPKAAARNTKTAVLASQTMGKSNKLNPFELKGRKSHFDAIGRRLGAKKQNVVKARQEAVNKRKRTLLVEYRQLRKANTFIDRRFGESDPELTDADRAIARLQAQRIQAEHNKKKRGSKFTLNDAAGEGGGLTHLGRSLADDLRDFMDRPELDDLDLGPDEEQAVRDLVAQYHFGGGEEGQGEAEAGGPDGKPKTRKQIMEEIIAKSRMHRALKARQREEDAAALEASNREFRELVRSAALARFIKPPGADKGLKAKPDNAGDAAYDVAARELAFESTGAAGERTLGPEELQERERQRLERLERERIRRMRGEGEEEEEDGEESEEEDGGGRKRRRDMPSGDALGDQDFETGGQDEDEGEDEDEGVDDGGGGVGQYALDERRMRAAAGAHPLQVSFRAAAAALADKYGVQAPRNPYLEEEGEGEEEEDEEEQEESEEMGEGQGEEAATSSGAGDEQEKECEGAPDALPSERPAEQQQQQPRRPQQPTQQPPSKPALDGPLDLPYTIPLPLSYQEFASLVGGRPAEDLHTAIQRIRAFNAVALATDSKRKMQEFLGLLVQHFAMLAGQSPLPVPSLDVLTRVLLELTPEVPGYTATVARARLTRMTDQMTAILAALGGAGARTAAGGVPAAAPPVASSPWPPARVVLLLKLFAMLFPTSDRRHPVLAPAALLVGKYLDQCPVSTPHEAAVGLSLCGLMSQLAAPARRTTPEVLVFLRGCLSAFIPPPPTPAGLGLGSGPGGAEPHRGADLDNRAQFTPGLLALGPTAATSSGGKGAASLPLDLYRVLGMPSTDPWFASDECKLGLLRVALCGVQRAATLASESGLACFEQLFASLRDVVGELQRMEPQLLPAELRELCTCVLNQLTEASAACVASRRPLVHPGRARSAAAAPPAAAVREFNPRFEDGFATGRDYDPDRQRAEARRLKRALVKERRGAMRELRRDAVFLAEERDRETARVDAERLESERRFYSELQRQEADLRSGGQGGMNPHLKKGKK